MTIRQSHKKPLTKPRLTHAPTLLPMHYPVITPCEPLSQEGAMLFLSMPAPEHIDYLNRLLDGCFTSIAPAILRARRNQLRDLVEPL
jgi:hypothetical protein